MKVLIIDDIEESVKGISDYCREKEWRCEISDFDEAYKYLLEFNPDVIILDWKNDANDSEIGETILNSIWSVCFRPVIVFSANAALIDIEEKTKESNLVKFIPKGDEEPVIKFLEKIEKFISSLGTYRKDMEKALISSMNFIDLIKNEESIEDNAIGYVLSKRTAAFFDKEFTGKLSPSWVQYLCPPVNDSLCVCDIIRKKSAEVNFDELGSPEEYCIVLTPSCDMCIDNGRSPKVSHVLCSHCVPGNVFYEGEPKKDPSKNEMKSVISKLNQGYNKHFVSVPGFANIIPYMTADMKKLELIKINSIAPNKLKDTENTEYIRVASISSPFREQIVWAYLQTSCRPGVPDRNTELWAKEILTL
ncbi:MAG: response regulator [Ruminococcaceae bacterium]|nr:response regulator [Oscillospiraceae bacterium]